MYDLDDITLWEPVLYGATSKKQLILNVLKKKESQMMSRINNDDEVRTCFYTLKSNITKYKLASEGNKNLVPHEITIMID